jgi:hypothetical protein
MKPQGTTSGVASFHGQVAMVEGGVAPVWKDWTPKRSSLAFNWGLSRIPMIRDLKFVSGSLEFRFLRVSLYFRGS